IKQTKVDSWLADEARINEFLSSKTKSEVRAAGTRVLGKPDAAVGKEMSGFNLPDCVFDKVTELFPLLIRDRAAKVLDFDETLSDEDNLCDLGNAGRPGIAHQLRIESQQTSGFFWISARSGLPLY